MEIATDLSKFDVKGCVGVLIGVDTTRGLGVLDHLP
jgi:hypothetical protein